MGRYRFRLADMIPNALHKLKDMATKSGKSKKADHPPTTSDPFAPPPPSPVEHAINHGRASYYIPRSDDKLRNSPAHPKASDTKFLLVDPPRKSRKKLRCSKSPSTKMVRSSVSSHCSCRASLGSMWSAESIMEYPPLHSSPILDEDDFDGIPCSDKPVIAEQYSRITASSLDSSIKSSADVAREVDLPPILTKPPKRVGCPNGDPPQPQPQGKRLPEGLRLRGNTPRLARKVQGQRARRSSGGRATTPRKGLSGSLAVVKVSSDPARDFLESMMEMILENNMKTSRDLEDLLACYLSLNSREYHDTIVKVFEQIWFDLTTTNARFREDS